MQLASLNVVSGTSYTYAQALGAVAALTGRRPAVTSRPRTKDKVDHRFDAARRVGGVLRVSAFTSMDEGLRRVRPKMTAAAPEPRS